MGNVLEEVEVIFQRVLVTGANGFVGSALCRVLVARGHSVIATIRAGRAVPDTGLEVFRLNLLQDDEGWLTAMKLVDCVVHLAANAHQIGAESGNVDQFHQVNTLGACFVAKKAAESQVKRFVLLSSIKVNGEGSEAVRYSANDVPQPRDAYSRSKLAAEIGVRQICETSNMQYACIRPPLVYGPGAPANFFRLMRLVELGWPLPFKSVNNRRSFVGIQNLNSFIEVCISHADACGTWLVSDDEDVSTPDLLRRLSNHLRCRLRLFSFPLSSVRLVSRMIGRQAEIERLCGSLQVDIEPALNRLGWRPPVSLDEGLALTTAAFRAIRGTAKRDV
jgi:nucleoside-diphosphate-sugar epimerase